MKRRALIAILLTLLIVPLTIEGLLRVLDPWGARRDAFDIAAFFGAMHEDSARNYILPPGAYQFSTWQALILPDGSRAVPDTNTNAACTIVLLGDSVTFGYGVSDAVTFANLLARDFPAVHIINSGLSGYNIDNVALNLQVFPANGYLYFLIQNDAEPEFNWHIQPTQAISTIAIYLYWVQVWRGQIPGEPSSNYEHFREVFSKLAARSDLVTIAYAGPLTTIAQSIGAVSVINRWANENTNSRVDPHANVAGNAEIEAQVKPIFAELINKVCRGDND